MVGVAEPGAGGSVSDLRCYRSDLAPLQQGQSREPVRQGQDVSSGGAADQTYDIIVFERT